MPLLVEAMSNGLIFPYECRGKQTEWPDPQSSGHPCRGVAAIADEPRLPTLRPGLDLRLARVPSSSRYCVRDTSALRSARDSLRETLASLSRWQSAFSPTTRDDRLPSWTFPAVAMEAPAAHYLFPLQASPVAYSLLTRPLTFPVPNAKVKLEV